MNKPSAPILEVHSLEHAYGKKKALDGLSFSVRRGEIFGLLGPNGGGKTTLFRILSTLLEPDSGTATIAGADVVAASAAVRREIGVVFQSPSLDIQLT
ncbi:MAG: ATP-binding cassette domain-containing protein, partial [bacterium]